MPSDMQEGAPAEVEHMPTKALAGIGRQKVFAREGQIVPSRIMPTRERRR